jgi:hypothetical protein
MMRATVNPDVVTAGGFSVMWPAQPGHDGSAFDKAIIGTVNIFPGQTGANAFTAPGIVAAVLSKTE